MTNHEKMLLALVSLKHKAELGIHDPKKGICDNLNDIINEIDPKTEWTIKAAFQVWDKRTGSVLFPVAGLSECTNYPNLWDTTTNPHAQKRWDLLDHCIRYYADLVSKQNG